MAIFLKLVLGWAKTNWLVLALCLALVSLTVANRYQASEITQLKQEKQTLQVENRGHLDKLEGLALETALLETALLDAQLKGQQVRKVTEVKVRTILAEPLPAKCEEAVDVTADRVKKMFSGRGQ